MATYKDIKGIKVESLSSDPPVATSLGEMWYNTTSGALKYSIEGPGAWSSGGTQTTALATAALTGTQTAAISMAGFYDLQTTLTYNGTAWTAVNNLTQLGRNSPGAFGTQSAALCAGGYNTDDNATFDYSETWDGTNWTEGNNINTPRGYLATANQGTTSAGLIFGGRAGPTGNAQTTSAESYDGTNWTESTALNTAVQSCFGGGTQTAAFCVGGQAVPAAVGLNQQWNGTGWTNETAINTARQNGICSGGTVTAALIAGGSDPTSALTESWNGTGWTEVADLSTARYASGKGTGSNTAALCAGGATGTPPPAGTGLTEEFNDPGPTSTVTFTAS